MNYLYIISPNSKKHVSVFSSLGKRILKKYINNIQIGGKKSKKSDIFELCDNKTWVKNQKCKRGPCWKSHVFVGNKCFTKGSCKNKNDVCSDTKHMCYKKACKNKINSNSKKKKIL